MGGIRNHGNIGGVDSSIIALYPELKFNMNYILFYFTIFQRQPIT